MRKLKYLIWLLVIVITLATYAVWLSGYNEKEWQKDHSFLLNIIYALIFCLTNCKKIVIIQ